VRCKRHSATGPGSGRHQISNLGDPKQAGDATRVDTRSIPGRRWDPARRVRVFWPRPPTTFTQRPPWEVAEAAPSRSRIRRGSPRTRPRRDLGAGRRFQRAIGRQVTCSIGAIVRVTDGATGTVELRLGGTTTKPDGTPVAAIVTNSAQDEIKAARADITKPSGPTLMKLVASTASTPGSVIASGKSMSFRSR